VIHASHERGALGPRPVLHVLFDTGVQVADAASGLGDGLAVPGEDEPEHAVGGGGRGPDGADETVGLAPLGRGDHLVPVASGGIDVGLGWSGHAYDLRWSGGGTLAPRYSTGIPPSGESLRWGWPCQSSGMWIRVRAGWPSKMIPKKSQASRSCQSLVG